MRYQKQGLAWMLSREAAGANPAGGMLCDEQGLGKTITAIALIASHPCEVRPAPGPSQPCRLTAIPRGLIASVPQRGLRKCSILLAAHVSWPRY